MSENSWLFHEDIFIVQQVEEIIQWLETSDLIYEHTWCYG